MSKGVTPQTKNYSAWYTDIVTKAELADYGPVKGTMVIRPYGFSLWELIKNSGCAGASLGDASVSKKHCNFFINKGKARSKDLEDLIYKVRNKVLKETGINL